MRKMKDSGIEWIGKIPEEWNVVANKQLMKKVKCIKEKYNGEDVLSLTMNGVIVRDLANPSGKMPATFDGYQFVEAGNLLMCLFDIDVTPRCIGLIKNDGVCSPAYSQFRLSNVADVRFYYYYYLNLDNTKELLHLAKNLRHSLTEEQLGAIPTVLPPLDEQRRICRVLDKKTCDADTLIANVQAQIEKLKAYKQSVVREAVTKGLKPHALMKESGIEWIGQIPCDWKVLASKWLMRKAKTIREKYSGESVLSLTTKGVITRDLDNPSGKMPATFDGYQFVEAGNLLMCLFDIDVTPRCIGLIKNDGVCSPAYSQFKLNGLADAEYYYYYYLSLDYTKELLHLAKNLRHSLTEEQFGAIPTVLPPMETQKEIAAYLNKKCAEIDRVLEIKQAKIEKLEQYKRSLIYEYVTGKKEVS